MQGLNQTAWVIWATGFIGKFLTAQLLKENYQDLPCAVISVNKKLNYGTG